MNKSEQTPDSRELFEDWKKWLASLEKTTMDRSQRTVDSLKLLQDWSKWLISLEVIICASLWPKLTGKPSPPGVLYAGWMMFWASIIVAAILLLSISVFVRRVDTSADSDMKKVWIMVGLQYACFLAGLFCFALRVILIWTGRA